MIKKTMHGNESEHQIAFAKAMQVKYPHFDKLWWHTPNGGYRDAREGAKFKRMGTKAGVPDISLMFPSKSLHGLFIELKRGANKLTKSQEVMIKHLREAGYRVEICYSWEEAIKAVDDYLN